MRGEMELRYGHVEPLLAYLETSLAERKALADVKAGVMRVTLTPGRGLQIKR